MGWIRKNSSGNVVRKWAHNLLKKNLLRSDCNGFCQKKKQKQKGKAVTVSSMPQISAIISIKDSDYENYNKLIKYTEQTQNFSEDRNKSK